MCFSFFVVITVASQSVLVSRLPLFSVSASTATCKAKRCCENLPYSIGNKLAACQEGGRRMWRSRPPPHARTHTHTHTHTPQRLAGNQALASSRYLNCDTIQSAYAHPCKIPSLTLRRLMSYIYGAHILDVSGSHTTTQHSR